MGRAKVLVLVLAITASAASAALRSRHTSVAAVSELTSASGNVKMHLGTEVGVAKTQSGVRFCPVLAEFIAMTLFVIIGCGCAMGIAKEPGAAWILQVSLTFGFAITSLAYAIGHYSGGQINCAVTFGLVLAGQLSWMQGLLNFVGQMLGSVAGAGILLAIYPKEKDRTGGLGSNGVGDGFSTANALIGEIMMTFLLVFVVLETAVNPLSEGNRMMACVPIGFAVFLAHCVLVPIDGCSINPTRSFGPAVVAKLCGRYKNDKDAADTLKGHWIFWVGPLVGAGVGACVYSVMHAVHGQE